MADPDTWDNDTSAGLPPPRFGLKTLMLAIAAFAVICAAFNYFGSHAVAILILLALVIFAHVAGNSLGTRLRASGDRIRNRKDGNGRVNTKVVASDFAPVTRLRQRRSLGRPIIFVTIAGAVIGGAAGGIGFIRLLEGPLALSTIGLGITAAAILGGIWTFIAASFLQVAASAIWQATREQEE